MWWSALGWGVASAEGASPVATDDEVIGAPRLEIVMGKDVPGRAGRKAFYERVLVLARKRRVRLAASTTAIALVAGFTVVGAITAIAPAASSATMQRAASVAPAASPSSSPSPSPSPSSSPSPTPSPSPSGKSNSLAQAEANPNDCANPVVCENELPGTPEATWQMTPGDGSTIA